MQGVYDWLYRDKKVVRCLCAFRAPLHVQQKKGQQQPQQQRQRRTSGIPSVPLSPSLEEIQDRRNHSMLYGMTREQDERQSFTYVVGVHLPVFKMQVPPAEKSRDAVVKRS
jgi:hypothetical protein